MYNILIIDNDQNFQKYLTELLDRAMPEAHVYQAAHIERAMDILKEKTIDLLLVDVKTIEITHDLLYERIREMNRKPLTIFLLSEQEITLPYLIGELKANGYFIKPQDKQLAPPLKKAISKDLVIKQKTSNRKMDTIMLSTAIGVCPVAIDTILAIERTQRNFLTVYTTKRILKEVRGTLAEFSKLLPENMVFINRQCIVDRTAITRIIPKTREVFLDIESNEVAFSCSRDKIRDIITWFNSFKD